MNIHPLWTRVWPYVTIVVLTSALLAYSLRVWRADVTVPLVNPGEGDTTYELAVAKGIIETGWHTHTPRASAPGELDNVDFPRPDSLHFLLWRFIAWLYPNPAFIFNAVGFLSYPLAALTMLYSLRQMDVSRLVGMSMALLYAFLPYHMARWTAGHMLLVMYYTVPLMALLAVRLAEGDLPFFERHEHRYRMRLLNARTLGACLLAVWSGSTSVYYAFFGCYFVLVAGAIAAGRRRTWKPIVAASLIGALCATTMTINTWPNRRYVQEHGLNCVVASRVAEEADIYGLRIAQLLLPRPQHRLDAFEYLRAKYEGRGIPEGANNALGILGSIGFVSLLVGLYLRRGCVARQQTLALLMLAGVLLATIGAFGSLFNFLINADIRAYNRIVVYLAFFAFTAFALLFERGLAQAAPLGSIGRRLQITPLGLKRRFAVCLMLTAFGYWDQTSGKVPAYERNAAKYHGREAFVQALEASVPTGAMIFQLPFMPYTESGPIRQIPDYSPALCYVHSQHTRWTYPAFSNRRWARWQEWVSEQTPDRMLRTLALAHFQGIHIDRRGYADGGAMLIATFQTHLQQEPLRSADDNFVFFDLGAYAERLRQTLGSEWEREAKSILERPYYSFQDGFRLGSKYRDGVYLAAVRSQLAIGNPSAHTVPMQLTMRLQRYSDRSGVLHVAGFDRTWTLTIQPQATPTRLDFEVPPGQHKLTFTLETVGTLSLMPNRLTEVWQADQVNLEWQTRDAAVRPKN